jgi:hypothetical protein
LLKRNTQYVIKAGIYAIQNAGLAISYGVWASLIVMTSFFWGVFVFHERVKSIHHAFIGVTVMVVGLIGMAQFSAPSKISDRREPMQAAEFSSQVSEPLLTQNVQLELKSAITWDDDSEGRNLIARRSKSAFPTMIGNTPSSDGILSLEATTIVPSTDGNFIKETEVLKTCKDSDNIHIHGKIFITRREMGILCAVINGVWGGMNMIPMHFAR